jgi:predicted amidohydrolase YtcJ
MAGEDQIVGALAIRDGIIIRKGSPAEMMSQYPHAKTRDLQGCTVLPGFIDGYIHLIRNWNKKMRNVDLPSCRSILEIQEALNRKIICLKGEKKHRVVAMGWNQENL